MTLTSSTHMKMVQLSLALACLLAGADAFGATPSTCDGGHTGNLAVLAVLGQSCNNIARGHDYTADYSCENEDGSDTLVTIGQGVDLNLKALCPEKCGVPCGHAPKVDNDAIGANWANDNGNLNPTCAALRDGGLCKTEVLANWFCGESCRGGAPWDECMWHKSARQQIDQDCADPAKNAAYGYEGPEACEADSVANYIGTSGYTKSARQQITDDCAVPSNLATWGYQDAAACEADNVANYLVGSTGTCPGSPETGADCYNDQNYKACPGSPETGADCYFDKNLFNYGSTQVAQCPGQLDPFRRRKLTRSGTHSDAMKTKGVFTLTASG